MPRTRIFVSYRRDDSQPWAARLIDDLRDYFGRDQVFRDVDSNRAGQDYIVQIHEALAASRVVIAVIGRGWVGATDDAGRRRLEQPEDVVRLEIETALSDDLPIVPVLVGGAQMPQPKELPSSIERLARVHATRLSDEDWPYHLRRLFEALEDHGVYAPAVKRAPDEDLEPKGRSKSRYERTLSGSRRRVYDAVAGTVEALNYERIDEDASAATITFRPRSGVIRETTAKVIDAEPGRSKLSVELVKVHSGGLAATSVFAGVFTGGIGALGYPAMRLWERTYVVGLLDNVQALLEGRGVGKDSALVPGLHEWRNRSREV